MKYIWQDLEKPLNAFTVRSATMRDLDTGEIIQYYSANTKIILTQKGITPVGTYYRTREAAKHRLNYAFEAAAFGLPNEIAPLAPKEKHLPITPEKSVIRAEPTKKQKLTQKAAVSKSGEKRQYQGIFSKMFRRRRG